jgi:RNA polymerase primary sigma factor
MSNSNHHLATADQHPRWTGTVNLEDALRLYVAQVKAPLLSEDEERELARRKDAGDEAAKWRLVESNLRLVMAIARQHRAARLPLLDMIQEGNLGLIRAVERFDYRLGYRLSTYASWSIREAILRAIGDQGRMIRLPENVARGLRRLRQARERLARTTGRPPTVAELATASGLTKDRVQRLLQLVEEPASLDGTVGEGDERVVDLVPDEGARPPEAQRAEEDRAGELAAALAELSPRLRDVLERRFGLNGERPETLQEVGSALGVSGERVRQLETGALRELAARAPSLRDYLDAF